MILKPKKTSFNAPAVVYRRVTRLERTRTEQTVFSCVADNSDLYYYIFDSELNDFVVIDPTEIVGEYTTRSVTSTNQYFQNGSDYFHWNTTTHEWAKTQNLPATYTLNPAGYSNIAKYQKNVYVYAGTFDYVITGEVAGTKVQPIKGNIMPLKSMNIKYYNDFINLDEEDLVVVNGALYAVESPDYVIKHMPRPYKIYYATLTSIL